MSLSLEFTPHSWYMGFAIQKEDENKLKADGVFYRTVTHWHAYTDNGNTYQVDGIEDVPTLAELKQKIRYYHINQGNGYGERIEKRANRGLDRAQGY